MGRVDKSTFPAEHCSRQGRRPRVLFARSGLWPFPRVRFKQGPADSSISHELIVDNAGGHLMQQNMVDMVIVGTDRTTSSGDVCNKIGTYLKALAARDNDIPFYVALPSTTIDWRITDGLKQIKIENDKK